MKSNILISWVRTVVAPFLAGLLGQFLAFLAAEDVPVDYRLAAGAAIGAGWYLLARFAQVYNPKLGFLLIIAAQPNYTGAAGEGQSTAEKLIMSVRRTVVPLAVGTAGTFAAKHGFAIDSAQVVLLLEGGLTSGYFTALRWIEDRAGSAQDTSAKVAGVLLGGKADVIY